MSLNSSTPSSRFDTNIRTHRRTTWLIVMIAGVVMQMTRAPAQVSDPNASLAAKVADGRPWKMTMEDGRPGMLVLF